MKSSPPIAAPLGFVQDPHPFYDRARGLGPLFLWEDYGYPCAAGHAEVTALLRDRRFGRELPAELKPARPAHLADFYALDDRSLLDREPPAHTRLRGLVLRAFTSRRIAGLAPEIAALAERRRLIDGLDGPEFDLLPGFAERLPVIVIARLLGVPGRGGRRPPRLVARHGRHVPGAPRPRRRGRRQRRRRRLRRLPPRGDRARRSRPADDLVSPSSSPPRRRATASTPTS